MKPAIPDHVSKQVNKRARNVKLMALRLLTKVKQTNKITIGRERNKNQNKQTMQE